MHFHAGDHARALEENPLDFMGVHVYPAEAVFAEQIAASGDSHFYQPVKEELKAEARRRACGSAGSEMQRSRHREHGAVVT